MWGIMNLAEPFVKRILLIILIPHTAMQDISGKHVRLRNEAGEIVLFAEFLNLQFRYNQSLIAQWETCTQFYEGFNVKKQVLYVNWRIILIWLLREYGMMFCFGLKYLKAGSTQRVLWTRQLTIGSHKRSEISSQVKRLSVLKKDSVQWC
jgi:hypothetical protein